MRYLMRDGAPLGDNQWQMLDGAVVQEATKNLVGRRFLSLRPVGARTQTVPLDRLAGSTAATADIWGRDGASPIAVTSRRNLELATVYSDFTISWRDLEDEQGAGVQAARDAAVFCARREDDLVFYGDAALGIEGIFTAQGVTRQAISDWNAGESPVLDLSKAIETLVDQGNSGERALVISTDLYAKLHRIQPGTGIMEVDRVRSLVGKLYRSARIQKNSAALVYCDPQNLDLVVGQDMITAYMGNEKLDHVFRVMETVVPRIKRPEAIAVLS
ncbi:MAG: bacteriocin family protein [Planctomycetes bacterium]|nr:bacteriocin family protein [Planctomycetota bacterium]